MNRRGFLAGLVGATAGMVLDPERALWRPGQRLISIPKPIPLLRKGETLLVTLVGGGVGTINVVGKQFIAPATYKLMQAKVLSADGVVAEFTLARPVVLSSGDSLLWRDGRLGLTTQNGRLTTLLGRVG